MKIALLFSGQGSQSVGMGYALYHNFKAAKDVLDEVDETLHQKLSTLMFEGDLAELTQTQNAQPAIMAVGMAVVRTLEQELGDKLTHKAAYMAGHSLGEYTALCAAGSMTLRDTAKLLHMRGWAFAWGSSIIYGGMTAVLGLSREQLAPLIAEASQADERVYLANDNCPGQLIVSGHQEALKRLKTLAEGAGAKKVIPLNVSGAFHSPYMKPAVDELLEEVEKTVILSPQVPVIANVTALPESNPERIKKNLLAQMTGTVLWTDSMNLMVRQGADTFMECAAGRVMAGLAKRICPDKTILSVGDVDSLQVALKYLTEKST